MQTSPRKRAREGVVDELLPETKMQILGKKIQKFSELLKNVVRATNEAQLHRKDLKDFYEEMMMSKTCVEMENPKVQQKKEKSTTAKKVIESDKSDKNNMWACPDCYKKITPTKIIDIYFLSTDLFLL